MGLLLPGEEIPEELHPVTRAHRALLWGLDTVALVRAQGGRYTSKNPIRR